MNKRYITAALLVVIATATAQAQAMQHAPKLVVNITIDQLCTNNLEKYSKLYSSTGFKKLLREGMVYNAVSYPFEPVDKASAITAIMTGTSPYYNGIIGTQKFDRNTLRPTGCTDGSPKSILTSTITDELKVGTDGRALVYAIAGDNETAIISAGHAADAALWIDSNTGKWNFSRHYSTKEPKWLNAFNKVDASDMSASKNDRITKMALQCVDSNGMGTDDISDFLSVTYDADNNETSYIGIDRNIGELISKVENKIGAQNVLFMITGTGYDNSPFDDYQKFGIPTGTFYINRTANLLNMYLGAIYGQGRYVEACFRNQLFLNKKLIEQRRLQISEILDRSQSFLMQTSGVRDVFTSESLTLGYCGNERVRNGYNPFICGDIVIEVAPGWTLHNEETQEKYQQRSTIMPFQIIVYGNGIRPERINTPVTIDRIAPTIAKTIRIRAPNACRATPLF